MYPEKFPLKSPCCRKKEQEMALLKTTTFAFKGRLAYVTSHDSGLIGVTLPTDTGVHVSLYFEADTAEGFASALLTATQQIVVARAKVLLA